MKSIQAAKGVILQIIRNINWHHSIHIIETSFFKNCSVEEQNRVKHFLAKETKHYCKINNVLYFGKRIVIFDKEILEKFELSRESHFYKRILKDSCIMYATCEKENSQSCNYYAKLKDGSFVKLHHFVHDPINGHQLILYKKLHTQEYKFNKQCHTVRSEENELKSCKIEMLSKVCVIVEINTQNLDGQDINKTYICEIPNLYHYN